MEPSCPVFIACSISSASPPLHSPTIIRSGLIRREFRTRSRGDISPVFSILGGLVSSRTTCSWWRLSSAASSIVIMRSSSGMKEASAFKRVVFPVPVPPEINIFRRALTAPFSNRAASPVRVPYPMRLLIDNLSEGNFLIVNTGPIKDMGGTIIFSLEPSGSLPSTNGELSSTLLPMGASIRSIILIIADSDLKGGVTGVRAPIFSR